MSRLLRGGDALNHYRARHTRQTVDIQFYDVEWRTHTITLEAIKRLGFRLISSQHSLSILLRVLSTVCLVLPAIRGQCARKFLSRLLPCHCPGYHRNMRCFSMHIGIAECRTSVKVFSSAGRTDMLHCPLVSLVIIPNVTNPDNGTATIIQRRENVLLPAAGRPDQEGNSGATTAFPQEVHVAFLGNKSKTTATLTPCGESTSPKGELSVIAHNAPMPPRLQETVVVVLTSEKRTHTAATTQ